MNVFFIAKTYDVAFLGDKCVSLLKSSVGDNTSISIFQAAKGECSVSEVLIYLKLYCNVIYGVRT